MKVNKQREEVEILVYKVMDALDPSGTNSSHYKEKFSQMTDAQFTKFLKNELQRNVIDTNQ